MKIRKAKPEDMPQIRRIYAHAREEMRKNGNPSQWGDSRPGEDVLLSDIALGDLYLCEAEHICGVFSMKTGADPTYAEIDGAWLDDGPYLTLHRVASDNTVPGILTFAVNFAWEKLRNIRIDTHKDNAIMRHCIEKNGFTYCGVILTDDGTPRLAYQKIQKEETERI